MSRAANQCWCGSETIDVDKHGKGNCNMPCVGASHEMCGGTWAISMYENGGAPKDIPTDTKYLGCFKDQAERALSHANTSSNDMTYEVRKVCRKVVDLDNSSTLWQSINTRYFLTVTSIVVVHFMRSAQYWGVVA